MQLFCHLNLLTLFLLSLRAFGFFMLMRPVYVVRDVELVKQITIKDFDHFVNHDGNLTRASDGLFAKSVLLLEDNAWREMRNIL